MGFAGDGGRQDNATVFGHVLRRWPLAQSSDDVLAQSVGQLAVEGFGTEEADGALVGDGRAGIGGFGVVEGNVAPVGVLIVHDGPHFKRLGDHEFQIEEAATVNALPAKNEGAVVEFSREFGQQFIAHTGHGRGVVRPARAVFHRRTCVFDLGVKGLGFERFFEEELRQPHAVRQHRRDDEGGEEDTGDDGETTLSAAPGTLSGQAK